MATSQEKEILLILSMKVSVKDLKSFSINSIDLFIMKFETNNKDSYQCPMISKSRLRF